MMPLTKVTNTSLSRHATTILSGNKHPIENPLQKEIPGIIKTFTIQPLIKKINM
jgi:hypothetical protein